ncbi:unnamed protein product, partial [Symbiodinium microadriaticum]
MDSDEHPSLAELVGVAAALQARLQLLRQQAEQLCFLPGAAAATKLSICISKEALLASFIMRTLSKGAEQYDVSDILKNLHDAGSVAAEGPKDLTLWSYRAQLLQHVADKTLAFDPPLRGGVATVINDMIGRSNANSFKPELLEQMQQLQKENDQLRLLAAG